MTRENIAKVNNKRFIIVIFHKYTIWRTEIPCSNLVDAHKWGRVVLIFFIFIGSNRN